MTQPTNKTPTQSDAARLAGVLTVLIPSHTFGVRDGAVVSVSWPRHESWLHMLPESKDDLACVVAMLSPGQLHKFEGVLSELWQVDESPDYPFAWAIKQPASVWLTALCAAVGVEK